MKNIILLNIKDEETMLVEVNKEWSEKEFLEEYKKAEEEVFGTIEEWTYQDILEKMDCKIVGAEKTFSIY